MKNIQDDIYDFIYANCSGVTSTRIYYQFLPEVYNFSEKGIVFELDNTSTEHTLNSKDNINNYMIRFKIYQSDYDDSVIDLIQNNIYDYSFTEINHVQKQSLNTIYDHENNVHVINLIYTAKKV